MNKLRSVILVAFTALPAVAAVGAELDRAAAVLAGTEAQFTQSFTPGGFSRPQTESGSVTFGALPMMRWEYRTPEQKLFVFDGTRSWFYVPADKQVTVATLDEEKRADMPFLVIGDPASRERHFTVGEQTRGAMSIITLDPRQQSAPIRNIRITIVSATHAIERVEYTDREGNQTVFAFSGQHRKNTPRDLFQFTPPAGVQVVSQ
jgi:outer membrane lipoprotein carrier protein